jgi:hypothetical protein
MKHLFDPQNLKSVNQNFRSKRFKNFIEFIYSLKLSGKIKILDIGGTQAYWDNMNLPQEINVHITLLNLNLNEVSSDKFSSVIGNATDLKEYQNNSFEIVFSNSCIEHLFTYQNQRKMQNHITNQVLRYRPIS